MHPCYHFLNKKKPNEFFYMIPSGPFGGTLYPSPCNRASPKSDRNIFLKFFFDTPDAVKKVVSEQMTFQQPLAAKVWSKGAETHMSR